MYEYGLIGNCQVSALVDKNATITWLCMPKFDGEPIFGSLLDPNGGLMSIRPEEALGTHQYYLKNTNVLVTEFKNANESQFTVTDFCPRFEQHGRMYRPASLFRIIKPLKGAEKITIRCIPILGWDKTPATPIRANSHLRYDYPNGALRVVTNMPLTYLLEEKSFLLQEPIFFAVIWDSPFEADLKQVSYEFLDRTIQYWQKWVKHCTIPSLFQEETIRSALALKLHCFEDTGAIIAATTTSLPEKIGGERNWDYRFCWLRDAFFTLSAFHQLGHFEEMEGFLRYILNLVNYHDDLLPLYSLNQRVPLPEQVHPNWAGYKGSQPVRTNNAAAEQIQNDIYGELILVLSYIYFDERFHDLRSSHLAKTLDWLVRRCCHFIGKSDAGIWEIRGERQEHSFTNLMCWAGIDRTIRIIEIKNIPGRDLMSLEELIAAQKIAETRIKFAVKNGIVRNSTKDFSLDASLLMLPILNFPEKEICRQTTDAIADNLNSSFLGGDGAEFYLFRYQRDDDFGTPEDPFLVCSFWLAQAYARLGDEQKGIKILNAIKKSANSLGLFAEHYSPLNKIQLGNFPQAYSHVGLVNAAFSVSPRWIDIL